MPRFEDGTALIIVDESDPAMLMVTNSGVATERLVREFFAWQLQFAKRVHARGGRYVVVIDARDAGRPPASVRRLVSSLTDELRAAAPNVEIASLFVAENALVRGALTALIWISRSAWRPILVGSTEQAVATARQLLQRAAG